VPAGLLDDPFAGVDEYQGEVGRRIPGDHVARVLHVARGIGDDEFASRCGEVAVGHIDGDPLLTFGAEPVREEGEVGVLVAALSTHPLD
jgi:hypothetical protein